MFMNNWLQSNGFTHEEEVEFYDLVVQDVYDNPRWYLDNLEYIVAFRVSWKDYRTKTAVLPHKYVKKQKVYK